MRPSDRAWATLAGGIIAWDVMCGQGEMLSDASRRYTLGHPILWPTLVVFIAGHLCHIWPERIDPLSRLAAALGR